MWGHVGIQYSVLPPSMYLARQWFAVALNIDRVLLLAALDVTGRHPGSGRRAPGDPIPAFVAFLSPFRGRIVKIADS
jgi:hypothetical protein